MVVKDWFKRAKKSGKAAKASSPSRQQRGHTIDELIVLERYDEAETRLRERLKNSDDVHARLKLAEVLMQLRRSSDAVEEFLRVSELYSRDGFQDKAAAVLRKAAKLDPMNEGLRQRLARIEDAKALERTRKLAVQALKEASRTQSGRFATAAIELEQMWDRLAQTDFVKALPADQMKRLLASTEIMRLPSGSRLATKGESKPELYLIAGGEIEATAPSDRGRVTLRSFSAGHLIGDRALLEHKVWPADYTASRASSALRLTRAGLENALLGNPDPRALLDGLRQQRNDQTLVAALEKLGRELELATLPIRIYPDPVLRTRCARVERFDDSLKQLATDMIETMHAAPGIGLAASQVGRTERLAVVDLTVGEQADHLIVLVNPVLGATEGKTFESEGCLSLPEFNEKVTRHERLRVAAQNLEGEPFEAEGLLARAVQHEVDHLDGVLFVDRLVGLRKDRARRYLRRLLADQEESRR